MQNYQQLLESRLNYRNKKARGFEWKPVKMPYTKLQINDQGVPETIEKIIALSLVLEVPVGEWVTQATKKELPIHESAKNLLLSNVSDETLHFKAFTFVSEDYLHNQKHVREAESILAEWNASPYHPLEKAYYSEVGVFLTSLAILRIFGGETLATLGANVGRDEYRHVASNGGVLLDIGIDPSIYSPIHKMINLVLSWMLDDLIVPNLNKDFFIKQSELLVKNRYAPELERLTKSADDVSLFESPNYLLY